MKPDPKNVGDHLYVAVLLPFDRQMKIDEAAYSIDVAALAYMSSKKPFRIDSN